MARPLRIEFPGATYWISGRAISRQRLFRDAEDRQDFLARLPELASGFRARFHGFCLLPDRYEVLVETPEGNLSRVLHRLNSGYTATTNARRRRHGPLLQSRYRAVLLDDEWLVKVSLLMHVAPVREKRTGELWKNPYSSAGTYCAQALASPGVTTDRILTLAGGRAEYVRLVEQTLRTPASCPKPKVWRQVVLGGETLRQRVLDEARGKDLREIAGFRERRGGPSLEEVLTAVSERTGLPPEQIRTGKFQRVLARKAALYLARRFTSCTLREIGEAFGVDYTTVHMAARRVDELRRHDASVAAFLEGVEEDLVGRRSAPPAVGVDTPPTQERRMGEGREPRKPEGRAGQLNLF